MWTTLASVFALCGTPSPAPLVATPTPVSASAPDAQDLNLADPIRAAVRWMRSQQEQGNGSYGNSVKTTAIVLRAFAGCPDRYRSIDGPFVRRAAEYLVSKQTADGLISDDPKAPVEARRVETRIAVEALFALADPDSKAALGKALAALGDEEPSARDPRIPAEASPKELERVARSILAEQTQPGRWEKQADLALVMTASNVVTLSELERLLKKSAPSAAAPGATLTPLPLFTPADRTATLAALQRGADFLVAASMDGRWGAPGKPDAGLTAMVLGALQCVPKPRPEATQACIDKGLAWLGTLQKPDGSIHDGKVINYATSAAILAFSRSGDTRWKDTIARAQQFLVNLQFDDGEGYSEGDLYYGGIGYGSTERPDLSNLQMALEALASSGLEPNAPTYQKALKFLERCQNRSESNKVEIKDGNVVIKPGNDGGSGYAPGDSKAGFEELEGGVKVPRSYGSMTYALLKSLVFAGAKKDDPRVVAASKWVQKNYTLDVNPGFPAGRDPQAPYQGLFYYFHTMAQALTLVGIEQVVDGTGHTHAWRNELCGRVVSMQSKVDGSWINANSPRWMEGNPLLGTAYALLTLEAALPR